MTGQPDLMQTACASAAHALDRLDHLARIAADHVAWGDTLADGMFTLAEQFQVAAGFCLRAAYPLVGQSAPDLPSPKTGQDVADVITMARAALAKVPSGDLVAQVQHRAGQREVVQSAEAYLCTFALPNLWFHVSMIYAILRGRGVDVGKGDFDGVHYYPPGFTF